MQKLLFNRWFADYLKYAFEVSNTDFTLADAFDKPYYLFDRAAAQGVTAALRAELNSSLVNNRQSIVVDKADPSFYGLYPSAKMDQQATNVVTLYLRRCCSNCQYQQDEV
mgnify:CR=1 FL=1